MDASREKIKNLVREALAVAMSREKGFIVAANWKMNMNTAQTNAFLDALLLQKYDPKNEIVIAPPYPYIPLLVSRLAGSGIACAAQNAAYESSGAFTGEVSAQMLADLGCKYVILGHSERRHIYKESDSDISRKVRLCHANGVIPIVCVGEELGARRDGTYRDVLQKQLTHSLSGLRPEDAKRVVVAYEPVWAIGTGVVANDEQIRTTHAFIRSVIKQIFMCPGADVPILYGGSVKPDNIKSVSAIPEVGGFLIGGAGLKADSFIKMIRTVE